MIVHRNNQQKGYIQSTGNIKESYNAGIAMVVITTYPTDVMGRLITQAVNTDFGVGKKLIQCMKMQVWGSNK